MNRYTITAPAKINLALRVLGKRADGYHDLQSLVMFADCSDILTIEHSASDAIHISGQFAENIPTDISNSVLKTLHMLRAAAPTLPFFTVHLQKNIPSQAGLGGGSADAAAIIRFVMEFYAPLFPSDFSALALAEKIGADVPVCVHSKPAIFTGKGERLQFLAPLPDIPAILVYPPIAHSTADIFAQWKKSDAQQPLGTWDVRELKDIHAILQNCGNDLWDAAQKTSPMLQTIAQSLRDQGLNHFGMSGSGSAFFILCNDVAQRAAQLSLLQTIWPDFWIMPAMLRGN